MIRVNKQLNIALSPLSLSPCNHKARAKESKGQPLSLSSKNECSVTSSNATPNHTSHDQKRSKTPITNIVGQTSIEDLAGHKIGLTQSTHALANESSPKSPNE